MEGSIHIIDITQYHVLSFEFEEQWVFKEVDGVLTDIDLLEFKWSV